MGGLVCGVPHLAIMGANVIPTDHKELPAFDAKLRACCAQSDINMGLVEAELTDAACAILGKATWTAEDRTNLKAMLDSLYT